MLSIIILVLLTIILCIWIKRILNQGFRATQDNYTSIKSEFDKLAQENIKLKLENSELERSAQETIALYDITKDIRKILDEDQIFKLFKERINKYIKAGDCQFLKTDTVPPQYSAYEVFPIKMDKNVIGYLIADDIDERDRDKFHILAHQFASGVKGAFLFKRVQELTITDSLTQIFNRRYFLERFDEELRRSQKFKLKFSCLMVDIDHFKGFNDNYGHLVGDAILREITQTIKENMRQIDFVGRYGGEELSLILIETDKKRAKLAAERIRQAIEARQLRIYDEQLHVTISIGISTFPDDAGQSPAIIDKADKALYQAKQMGRNRVCVYGL